MRMAASPEPCERLVDQSPRVAQGVRHAIALTDELGLEHPPLFGLRKLLEAWHLGEAGNHRRLGGQAVGIVTVCSDGRRLERDEEATEPLDAPVEDLGGL